MLRALADITIPWPAVHIFQVDERVAPAGHADRNLTHLPESLANRARTKELTQMRLLH
jgi:6-phosphogluconolactonase/glucosamine-6-phosphate isomerase/deaminase